MPDWVQKFVSSWGLPGTIMLAVAAVFAVVLAVLDIWEKVDFAQKKARDIYSNRDTIRLWIGVIVSGLRSPWYPALLIFVAALLITSHQQASQSPSAERVGVVPSQPMELAYPMASPITAPLPTPTTTPRRLSEMQIDGLAAFFDGWKNKGTVGGQFCCSAECERYKADFNEVFFDRGHWKPQTNRRERLAENDDRLPSDGIVRLYVKDSNLKVLLEEKLKTLGVDAKCIWLPKMQDGISEVIGFEVGRHCDR